MKNRGCKKKFILAAMIIAMQQVGTCGNVFSDITVVADAAEETIDQEFEDYLTEQGFPESYKEALRTLHEQHPNWVFQAFQTGLDWDTVIENEMTFKRNLVPDLSTYPSSYKDTTISGSYDWVKDKWMILSDPHWVQASQAAVEYYMDPRNFLTEEYMFQFELETFNKDVQNLEGVEKILEGTFMSNARVDDSSAFADNEYVSSEDYSVKAAYLSGINQQTTVMELLSKLNSETDELYVTDAEGNKKSLKSFVGTGDLLQAVITVPVETEEQSETETDEEIQTQDDLEAEEHIQTQDDSDTELEEDEATVDASIDGTTDETSDETEDENEEMPESIAEDEEEKPEGIAEEEDEETPEESSEEEPVPTETKTITVCQIILFGDIDGNGKIDAVDRAYLKAYVYGTLNLTDLQLLAADANQDGTVDAVDRAYIKASVYGTLSIGQLMKDEGITYGELFMQIGEELNVSPYMLASRVRQEQGSGTSQLISGTVEGYEGYYNYFNIKASGTTREEIIKNGMEEAKENGWDSRYKAIVGGATTLCEGHIWKGQDTLYLQKFDVEGEYYGYYWHQYMQNLLAACSEGYNVYKAYAEMDALNDDFVFKIPVYENMPETACAKPTKDGNPNYKLKSLTVKYYTIDFKRDVYDYYIDVPRSVKSLSISAEAYASTTTVTGTGTISINTSTTVVKVKTKAENGDTKEYRIHLNRT